MEQNKRRKFLIPLLWVLGTFFSLAGVAFILTEIKNSKGLTDINPPVTQDIPLHPEPTDAEKLLKLQNEEIDTIRSQYQTQGFSQPTTTVQKQTKTIDIIRAQTFNQQQTIVTPQKTTEQQIQELDALRAGVK